LRLNKIMKKKLYILLLLITSIGFAQSLETKIDTTKNKIGAQFTLSLKVKTKPNVTVVFPNTTKPGALEGIEWFQNYTIKTPKN